jgi:hypothetical protein
MLNSPKGQIQLGSSGLLAPGGPALALSSTLPTKNGVSILTSRGLGVSDKDGNLRATVELAPFGGVADQPAFRLFAKKGPARAIVTLLPDDTGAVFLGDKNGTPSWSATGDLK